MDILSFILGMSVVVVIALAIVAVMVFVKVRNHKREIEHIHTLLGLESERMKRDMKELERQLSSTLDSRLDKFELKLKSPNKA